MFKRVILATILSALLISFLGYAGSKKEKRPFKATTSTESNTLKYDEYRFGAGKTDKEVRFKSIRLENKVLIMKGLGRDQRPYGMVGSTFSRNYSIAGGKVVPAEQTKVEYAEKLSLASAQTGYSNGGILTKTNGAVVAVCDGSISDPGHTQPEESRKEIHDFSQKACSFAVERLNKISDPIELEDALPKIVKEIREMPDRKNTTLTIGKAFLINGSYQYVGVNLGNSGVIEVQQNLEKGPAIRTISPPDPKRSGIGAYPKDYEVPIIKRIVPAGSTLVGLSFGAYQFIGTENKKNAFNVPETQIIGTEVAQNLNGRKVSPRAVVDVIKTVTAKKASECRDLGISSVARNVNKRQSLLQNQELRHLCTTNQPSNFEEFRKVSREIRELQEQGSDFAAVGIALP